jgi:hypothetical protein
MSIIVEISIMVEITPSAQTLPGKRYCNRVTGIAERGLLFHRVLEKFTKVKIGPCGANDGHHAGIAGKPMSDHF